MRARSPRDLLPTIPPLATHMHTRDRATDKEMAGVPIPSEDGKNSRVRVAVRVRPFSKRFAVFYKA